MFRILLAEDNPGDVLLFREALRARNIEADLVVAEDGHKAITLLDGKSGDRSPDLIVLDVNLPKRSGDEVLAWIRKEESLTRIPVVMLTSSASPADRDKATSLGASLYIQKSSNLRELFEVGAIIEGLLKPSA